MKNEKTIQLIKSRIKEDELILDMFQILDLTKQNKKYSYQFVVCSTTIFLIYRQHIKQSISIDEIKFITISCYSNELIIHTLQQDLYIESNDVVKIINNILTIKRRIFQDLSLFPVLIQKDKSLRSYVTFESSISKIFSGFFHKKAEQDSIRKSQRTSNFTLQVNDKNFIHQISRTLYKIVYQKVNLLYIGGMHGFIFNEFDYKREQLDNETYLYHNKVTNECLKMHKIKKEQEEQSNNNKRLRKYIQNYRYEDYKEWIYFGIQTEKCFQIIVPHEKDQQSLQELIAEERNISEMDLLSIFYKLMMIIDDSFYVLHSLSPKHIFIKDRVIISSVFCVNSNQINVNYMAPEELDADLSQKNDPELINLWKIGILLYEIAYSCLPFPIQYLAGILSKKDKLKVSFPHPYRTAQFKDFLQKLIQIQPLSRGGGGNWKKHVTVKQCRYTITNGQEIISQADKKVHFSCFYLYYSNSLLNILNLYKKPKRVGIYFKSSKILLYISNYNKKEMKPTLNSINSLTQRYSLNNHLQELPTTIEKTQIQSIRGMTLLEYFGINKQKLSTIQNEKIVEIEDQTDSVLQYDEEMATISKLSPKKMLNKNQKYKTQQFQLDSGNNYKSNYIKNHLKLQATQSHFKNKYKDKPVKVVYVRQNNPLKRKSPMRNYMKHNSLENQPESVSKINSTTVNQHAKYEIDKIRQQTKRGYENPKKAHLQFKNAFLITKCQFRHKNGLNKLE